MKEILELLKECRDQLVMCTMIDKSGQCKELVEKVDKALDKQKTSKLNLPKINKPKQK